MDALAYKVLWDTGHLQGEVLDANLERFDGWESVLWLSTRQFEVPDGISFLADFSITRQADYPCNDVNWPLMSPRMITTLREIGGFPHRVVPVRFIDRKVPRSRRYLRDGSLRPEVIDDRFAAVQILSHIDVVDWERSVFARSTVNPERVAHFDALVLVEPPGGLPPMFRVPAKPVHLFVSAPAYRALQVAGIRGATFEPVYGAGR